MRAVDNEPLLVLSPIKITLARKLIYTNKTVVTTVLWFTTEKNKVLIQNIHNIYLEN